MNKNPFTHCFKHVPGCLLVAAYRVPGTVPGVSHTSPSPQAYDVGLLFSFCLQKLERKHFNFPKVTPPAAAGFSKARV